MKIKLFDLSTKTGKFLVGVTIISLFIGGGFQTLSQQETPESCYLSSVALTMETIQQNYQNCQKDLLLNKNSLLFDINFKNTDNKMESLNTQLSSKTQLNPKAFTAVEEIFLDVRTQYWNKSTFSVIAAIFITISLVSFSYLVIAVGIAELEEEKTVNTRNVEC